MIASKTRIGISVAAIALTGAGGLVQGAILGPYLPDGDTVMLFHLDEPAGTAVAANAVPGGNSAISFDGDPVTAGAVTTVLGAAGLEGFGNCANLMKAAAPFDLGLGYDADGSGTFVPEASGTSPDTITWASLADPVTHAFTFEALINMPSMPTGTVNRQILSLESAAGATARGFHFRINGNTGSLTFDNIATQVSPDAAALIPTSGPHAWEANVWFHVAVVFDGSRLQFYWTRVDPEFVEASPLGGPITVDPLPFNGPGGRVLVFGNEGRSNSTESLNGLIDEIRISKTARGPGDFIFGIDANRPPAVSIGPDRSIPLTPGTLTLDALVSDDGRPDPPGATTSLWTVDSQPEGSMVLFGDVTQPSTSVTVDTVGVYVLRLTACDDGLPGACAGLEGFDTLTLTVEPGYIWDGGDPASDHWSQAANWVMDLTPILTGGATSLTFTGSTRLTPYNDAADADIASIFFDADAGPFELQGNGLLVQSRIVNNSAQTQTFNTGPIGLGSGAIVSAETAALSFLAGLALGIEEPVNVGFQGAFSIAANGAVTGPGNIVKTGLGDLLLASDLNDYSGGTSVNEGTVTVAADQGLGLTPADATAMTFVDAVGGAGGNTVRASDDDPSAWYAPGESGVDGLWHAAAFSGTSVYEAGSAAEDAPLLKTTVSGLTPGQTYTLGVLYWSRANEDWTIRAGLAPESVTLFNRVGGTIGEETAVGGAFAQATSDDGTQVQYLGILGAATADAGGQIAVYIDDLPSTGPTRRTQYDGVAFIQGALPPSGAGTSVAGGASKAALQLTGNISVAEPVGIGGRQPTEPPSAHIRNVSGHNVLTREITYLGGGNEYFIESAADQLTIQDVFSMGGGNSPRYLYLKGDGDGVVNGAIHDGTSTGDLPVTKQGAGTWTLTNDNPDVDFMTVSEGTLALVSSLPNNIPDAAITLADGAVLDVTGLSDGGMVLSAAHGQRLVGPGTVLGHITVSGGATLSTGATSAPGTLTVSNGVTFQDGCQFKARLVGSGSSLRVTGGALVGAGPGGVALDIDATDMPPGTYTLIDWTGASAAGLDVSDFALTGLQNPCLAGALRIEGSRLLFDYAGPVLRSGRVDDHQSYPVGNVDALVGIPWRAIPEAGANPQVIIGQDGANQFLGFQMSNAVGNCGRGAYRPLACYKIPDGQTRTLFFRWSAAAATSLNHYIGLTDSTYAPTQTGTDVAEVDDMRVRLRLAPAAGGRIAIRYHDGNTDVTGRDNLTANTWYNVWVVVRNNPGTGADVCDYYINTGAQPIDPVADRIGANVPFRGQVAAELANFAAVAWTASGQTLVRIDDIHVFSGEMLEYPLPFGGLDFNDDGRVDDADMAVFLACVSGPTIAGPPPGCTSLDFVRADTDNDWDVDQDDFGVFQRCYSGADAGDPECAGW